MKMVPRKSVRPQRSETQAMAKVNELFKILDTYMRILRIPKMSTETSVQ